MGLMAEAYIPGVGAYLPGDPIGSNERRWFTNLHTAGNAGAASTLPPQAIARNFTIKHPRSIKRLAFQSPGRRKRQTVRINDLPHHIR
jgi:hypothetical protein